jgi:hypothetical protein
LVKSFIVAQILGHGIAYNVCSNNAVAFAARKRCGEGRYQQLILLAPEAANQHAAKAMERTL